LHRDRDAGSKKEKKITRRGFNRSWKSFSQEKKTEAKKRVNGQKSFLKKKKECHTEGRVPPLRRIDQGEGTKETVKNRQVKPRELFSQEVGILQGN